MPGSKYVCSSTDLRELIRFQDLSNIKYVEESTGKKFQSKEEAQLSLYSSYPVIFTNTPSHGSLPRPFPRQYLVMIALGSLHSGNGLPTNVNAKELSSGQYVVINGNEVMRFSGKGSGMALFLILDLMEPCSEDGNAGAEK